MSGIPQAEIERREAIKSHIERVNRDRKRLWDRFYKQIGDGNWAGTNSALHRATMERDYVLRQELAELERELPPHLVWNPAGYLERRPTPTAF